MLYKSGGALDLRFGSADSGAKDGRTEPVAGDQRMLVAMVNGQPAVVRYVAKDPTAGPTLKWSAHTEAGGDVSFDRVEQVAGVGVEVQGETDYDVSLTIPFRVLGIKPAPGMRIRMDWGVIVSDTGSEVRTRQYWADITATGVADAVVEARLFPNLWGHIVLEGDASDADVDMLIPK